MPKGSRGTKAGGGRPKTTTQSPQQAQQQAPQKQKTKFTPATDKQSAYNYAKSTFNISMDTKKMTLESMNIINEAMLSVKDEFGDSAFSLIHHIGVPSAGTASNVQGYYRPATKGLAIRHVGNTNPKAKWLPTAQAMKKSGFWSTDNPLHSIYHELGHGIEHGLTKQQLSKIATIKSNTLSQIQNIQSSGGKAWKGQYLSKYGFTSTGEFIAESVAEYMNGNPRPTAASVVKVIMGG